MVEILQLAGILWRIIFIDERNIDTSRAKLFSTSPITNCMGRILKMNMIFQYTKICNRTRNF